MSHKTLEGKVEQVINEQTFRKINPLLMGYARRSVKSEALAEDLVQESWHAATRYLHTFDGRASLQTWMVGILKHKIIDNWRRTKREIPMGDAVENSVEDHVEGRLDDRRALGLLAEELKALPALQRTAVQLVDVEGGERADVAQTMEITSSHLRVLLHRGRHHLRRSLENADVAL